MKPYENQKFPPEERAQALLSELSLDEKMAQTSCIFPFGEDCRDFEAIKNQTEQGIGQVSTLEMRRMETLEEACAWQRTVQRIIMENSPHHIPAVFHMEGLCGAFVQGAASFPSGIARGSSFDPELEQKIAEIVSSQEAACGITQILAPVLDITRDPRMGRHGESYSEDPVLAAAMGAAYVRGIQKAETAGRRPESAAKHFLGFHASQGGIHGVHADIPQRALRELFAKPFQAAITESRLRGIMPCYCSIDGEPATASHALLQGLLREEMGFDGVVISDYGAVSNVHTVQHIGEALEEAALRCMAAGIDIELPSAIGFSEKLKEKFASGEADIKILDTAVLRILTAKFRMGLFEAPFALQGEELKTVFFQTGAKELSLRSARESMVLLKNDGALPISKEIKRLAVIGPHAVDAGKFFGGYTNVSMAQSVFAAQNSIAGIEESESKQEKITFIPGTEIQSDETEEFQKVLERQQPGCPSLLEYLQKALPGTEIIYARGYEIAGSFERGFAEALKAVQSADAAVLTLGGNYGTCSIASMGEGVDASSINLPTCQDDFILAAKKCGKPLIGVHLDGRPISSDAADQCLNAILEAWSPAEAGAQAITEVLLGDYNPDGRLPVTVARCSGQLPIYYNHPFGSAWHQGESIGFSDYVDLPHTPRYFFGHGLSYTEFDYSELCIAPGKVEPCEKVEISFHLQNIGKQEGTEIVQLYLSDKTAGMVRPVKELQGFRRVRLLPGERKKVVFTVYPSQTAFLDGSMRWKIEKGVFDVQIGSSSEDIRLQGSFCVQNDEMIDGKYRCFWAENLEERIKEH